MSYINFNIANAVRKDIGKMNKKEIEKSIVMIESVLSNSKIKVGNKKEFNDRLKQLKAMQRKGR